MRRKGSIELSANFIVVMVISSVIVVGGLALFFQAKNSAQDYVNTLDQQTEAKIKSMVLGGNYPVAVYPSDPIVASDDSKLIGLGITNNFEGTKTFVIRVMKIVKYKKDGTFTTIPPSPHFPLNDADYNIMKVYYNFTSPVSIDQGAQAAKAILLKMPKGSESGQYVYTINVSYIVTAVPYKTEQYGVVQVFVTHP